MPDTPSFSQNVALQVQQPNAMTNIGQMLNMAGTVQNIQRGGLAKQEEQMNLQERNALRGLAGRLSDFKTPEGQLDLGALSQTAAQVAPKIGLDWVKNVAATVQAGEIAKQSILATDEKTRQQAGGILLGIADATPEVQKTVITHAAGTYPNLAPAFNFMLKRLDTMGNDPEARKKAFVSAAKMVMTPEEQKSLGTPSGPVINTGTEQGVVNTQPFLPQGVVPSTVQPANLVPPQGQETQTTDALGRPVIQTRTPQGQIDYKPPPGSSYRPLMTLPAGETPQTAAPLLQLRDQAQAAAAAVPAQRFNNRQILSLADSAFTGTGSPELAKVLNSVGLQRVSGDAAEKTAQLQHFIGLQIQQNAASMGANTDAARQLAAQAVLPGNSPAQAIKAITKINDAYASGTELFNAGLNATLQNPNNTKDVFAIRDFQNQWTANFDPRILLLDNAVKAGDKAEVARIKASLGPQGIKELTTKAQMLQRLIHQGAVGGP